jgi:hypothetical protein
MKRYAASVRLTTVSLYSRLACFLSLLASFSASFGQAPATRFDSLLENKQVSVFSLDLPHGRRASVFQNTHDVIWIALNSARVTMADRNGDTTAISFQSGDARFFPSFRTVSIANDGGDNFRGVLIEMKQRGLASSCDCDGAVEKAVCGCARAAPLPRMWAVGIGSVVLGGTTLAPGESFQRTANRGDTLLVAVTALSLVDEAATGARIDLRSGEVRWIQRGVHKFRNTGSAPARYITLEF